MAGNPYIKTPFPEFKNAEKLTKTEAVKEVEALREAIEYHNRLYYIENKPEISDSKFDELFHRLEEIERKFPELKSDTSPTRKVGAPPVSQLEKRKHTAPLLSLKSSEKEKDMRDFVRNMQKQEDGEAAFVVEPKFDGLSVEVIYNHGRFNYGTTRGDGITGEDISENIKTIRSLPLKLHLPKKQAPAVLALRGEVFISRNGFNELNKKRIENGKEPFANPRNAAAGLMRQLDSKKVAGKPIDIFFYEILESSGVNFQSHWKMLHEFPSWGLKTSPLNKQCSSFSEISDVYHDLVKKRDQLDYEIDGMVVKLDDRGLREKIGARQRNPRWAFAWKFPPKKEVTVLRDIVVQVGRTGILTPVALLDPVEIGGVTVSRATLHNQGEVNKKDVRPGDKVKVIRAGDVIPEIAGLAEKNNKREKPFAMPEKCPVCGTTVVEEGAYMLCPAGLACHAQLVGRIGHFASKRAVNIDLLGPKTVEQLVEKGFVEKLPDLYRLKPEQLQELDGFAKKSAEKLYESIQKTKHPELHRFLYALGIRHVGEHVARLLANKFKTLGKIADAEYDDLIAINEIGPEIAESIAHFFKTGENLKMLNDLKKEGFRIKDGEFENEEILKGKTLVITGELESFTRDEAREKIESLGGHAAASVSGNTDYLVLGKNPGSKFEKAKKEKVKIIKEKQFRKLLKTGKLQD